MLGIACAQRSPKGATRGARELQSSVVNPITLVQVSIFKFQV
jgi:hypothetical protein